MKSAKIISLSLIAILIISSFVSSNSNATLPKISEQPIIFDDGKSDTILTKHYKVSIDEKKTQFANQEVSLILTKRPTVDHTTRLDISEKMMFSNGDGSNNPISLLKYNPVHAVLERIFNQRKLEFDNIWSILSTNTAVPPPTDPIGGLFSDQFDMFDVEQNLQHDKQLFKIQQQFFYDHGFDTNVVSQISQFENLVQPIQYVTDSIERQSQSLLFIFAISAFYIIVRSENPNTKIQNYKKALSLIFIIILSF